MKKANPAWWGILDQDLYTFSKQKLTELEIKNLKRINEDVNWFTKKFDYRYQNEPWKNSKDAPKRAMEKLAKFL